jgi:hypothetical protein
MSREHMPFSEEPIPYMEERLVEQLLARLNQARGLKLC